jgi:hypothetical protein
MKQILLMIALVAAGRIWGKPKTELEVIKPR